MTMTRNGLMLLAACLSVIGGHVTWSRLAGARVVGAPPRRVGKRRSVSASAPIRYVAIGDSYSSGEGATPAQSWPALLASHLRSRGLNISLVANPSVTGWTSQQAIDLELPIYLKARPTFATLLIGVNDWVQGVSAESFRQHLKVLMDGMLTMLPDKKRLLVVTIPDFSATPAGATYGAGRDISAGIAGFNAIITDEAARRGLSVADVFPLSRQVRQDASLIAPDGLHPSAKEYALWERLILPKAVALLVARRNST